MKSFNFKSATNTKEATKLASGRATFLAGGMSLLPAMKLRLAAYSDLINIKKIKGLSGIKVSSKSIRVGATTTHAEVAGSKEVGKSIPSLSILADKFFKGLFETELKKGELIEAVEFEVPETSGYAKFPNPASRYAIVGVYIAKLKKEIRVAITGVESCVFRCKKIEDALSNNFSPSAIDNINISSKGFNADIHASAEYRAHIIKVMAKKAISSC